MLNEPVSAPRQGCDLQPAHQAGSNVEDVFHGWHDATIRRKMKGAVNAS
jgi:hypothetical protein